jgi:threonine-phosphate decarboxylase
MTRGLAMKFEPSGLAIDRTHGGGERNGEQVSYQVTLIDFSTSLNPLGPPPEAIAAYEKAVADISRYPPAYSRHLELQIGQWLGVDHRSVLAANGSTQLFYLVARGLKLRSPRVVIPTFSEIANALIVAGSQPLPLLTLAQNDFRLDLNELVSALEDDADGIFLGRPNSPTGSLVSLKEAVAIAVECRRHDAWCVFDEAFIEFADDRRSVVEFLADFPNLIILRSLTKIFAIAGLRLGYLISHPNNIEKLRNLMEPWSVNVVAEAVASACLEASEGFIKTTRNLIAQERCWLEAQLSSLSKLRVFPAAANFIMVESLVEESTGDFGRYLRRNGIVVRDLAALPGAGPGFYRLGIQTHQKNLDLIAAASRY